jgi:squalene-associated FAD-dependent desaturase
MPDSDASADPVVVVGGGWAGLSAATTLCAHKVPVLLLEAARQLGGRARSVRIGGSIVDNGQHLVIGAYQSLLTLMQQIGVEADDIFERLPLILQLYRGNKISLRFKTPRLPAPLHLLSGLLGAHGLSVSERLNAVRFARRLMNTGQESEEDISVLTLLHSQAQSPAVIRKLWEPLCVATLNTPIKLASAQLFIEALRTTFTGPAHRSDLLIPRRELSDLLPRPCADYLERNGTHIELGQRVTALELGAHSIKGVCVGERKIAARQVILATPHVITQRLLSRHPSLEKLAVELAGLGHEPVTTLYLQYPADTCLPLPVVGFEGALGQWAFDRRVCGQPGLMAIVISARGEHTRLPANQLIAQVADNLAGSFPHWPRHRSSHLIRDKRATFCARAGINSLRPNNDTTIQGLWLAGDYTNTGLPATLEGAVRSGQHSAQHVIRSLNQSNVLGYFDAYTR